MPITPAEAMKTKRLAIPQAVFDAFDELITKHIDIHGTAVINQSEAMDLVCAKLGMASDAWEHKRAGEDILTRDDVYHNGWMDVEESYREVGWTVEYDRPAYYESHEPTYTFSH